jgi:osmotically-inducible protein OsmY
MFRKLNTSVVEGKVLLTGGVRYPETRIQAVRIAWRVEGVREVIDEIQVEDTSGVVDGLRDFWITASLRKKLLFDAHVRSINYNIDTVNGIVYLTGIAHDEAELARVRGHARTVSRVRNIVSYVRLRDDAPPDTS